MKTIGRRRSPFLQLLRRVNADENGAVSLETILIIGAIALPILIFLTKVGWPMVKQFFMSGLEELQQGATDAAA